MIGPIDRVPKSPQGKSQGVPVLLNDRVAVVTGAGRGIGREVALCLAREGAAIVVNDAGVDLNGLDTEENPAAKVCDEIRQAGGRAIPSVESVGDFQASERVVATALHEFGRLDILVNNAGILRNGPLLGMSEEDFDAVVDVHMKGTFNMARHAAPVMRDQGYGRIINMTSAGGLQGNFGHTNYGGAKAGIMGMTFVWALELASEGITVNALAPSGATRMTKAMYERNGNAGRPILEAALNAPLVAYLASDRAAHVNGQLFARVGYGFSLYSAPRDIATMWQPGGWTPEQISDEFNASLGRHLQPVGIPSVRRK
jgi:NAD(P)-dependent dehydrogenase (short-subunit alcohol dehydrogenase family)